MSQIVTIAEHYIQHKQILNASFLEVIVLTFYAILPAFIDII